MVQGSYAESSASLSPFSLNENTRGRPGRDRPRWRLVHAGRRPRHGAIVKGPIYRQGARIRSGCRPSSRSRRRRSNSRSCLRPPGICRSCVYTSSFSPLAQYWSRMFQVLTRRSDFGLLSPLSHAAACLGPEPGADSHIFSHRLVARSVRPRPPRRPPNRLWTPRRFSWEQEQNPHVAYGTQLGPHPDGPSYARDGR